MKKLFLSFFILLVGCGITDSLFEAKTDNKNCIDVRRFKVLQALYGNLGLAYECYTYDCSDSYHNTLDFIVGDKMSEDLYDGMIYEVRTDKCAVRKGIYKYKNKEGDTKTVSRIIFQYKNKPKTEEETEIRREEYREDLYKTCLHDFENENIKKDEKYCACYTESFINSGGSASAIKKECKKLPKFLITFDD